MSEGKETYRVYKLTSQHTDKYYVDYTKSRSYLSVILQGLILKYKKNGDTKDKFKHYFYIISNNDLKISELKQFDNYNTMKEYLNELYADANCINNKSIDDYTFDTKNIRSVKEKVNQKEYLKGYYEKNKEKFKERYQKNREEILKKKKEEYVSKKENKTDIE